MKNKPLPVVASIVLMIFIFLTLSAVFMITLDNVRSVVQQSRLPQGPWTEIQNGSIYSLIDFLFLFLCSQVGSGTQKTDRLSKRSIFYWRTCLRSLASVRVWLILCFMSRFSVCCLPNDARQVLIVTLLRNNSCVIPFFVCLFSFFFFLFVNCVLTDFKKKNVIFL